MPGYNLKKCILFYLTNSEDPVELQSLECSIMLHFILVFTVGRVHNQFENITSNVFQSMDNDSLRDWISASLKKFSQGTEERYRGLKICVVINLQVVFNNTCCSKVH